MFLGAKLSHTVVLLQSSAFPKVHGFVFGISDPVLRIDPYTDMFRFTVLSEP